MTTAWLPLLMMLLVSGRGLADTAPPAAPDKSQYNLFRPVPDDLLRELDVDRPDKTNSPHTLDAGHFQIETGLVTFTRNTNAGIRTTGWTWVDSDLRIGLLDWAELQLEMPPYQTTRDTDLASGPTDHSRGIGDFTALVKANLWGNDAGRTAGGVQLFVKAPTASGGIGNGEVEGGAAFLFSVQLPVDFDLSIENGVDSAASDGGGHHAEFVNSVSLSHAIVGPLSAYLEFFSSVPTQDSVDWEGTVDLGSLLTIGRNFQLDGGVNIGVTQGADDLQPFLGAAYRF